MFGSAGGKENVAGGNNVRRPLNHSKSDPYSNVKPKIASFGSRNRSQSPAVHQPKNVDNAKNNLKRPSLFNNGNDGSRSRSQSPGLGGVLNNVLNNVKNAVGLGAKSDSKTNSNPTSGHTRNPNSNNPLLNRSSTANHPFANRGGGV